MRMQRSSLIAVAQHGHIRNACLHEQAASCLLAQHYQGQREYDRYSTKYDNGEVRLLLIAIAMKAKELTIKMLDIE